LAVYRLTKLVTDDGITQPLRDRVIEAAYVAAGRAEAERGKWLDGFDGSMREGDWQQLAESDPDPPKMATLVVCPWCSSVWLALGLAFVVRRSRWWPAMADALAWSAAAGVVTEARGRIAD
jgi:hypothetical protein